MQAKQMRPGTRPGLVNHSDRGSPYASDDYRRALAGYGMVSSMSRSGDCWDNAVVESSFATLKAELVKLDHCLTHANAVLLIADDIDGLYNPTRRHSSIGYLSPIEFESKAQVDALAASSNRPRNRGRSQWVDATLCAD